MKRKISDYKDENDAATDKPVIPTIPTIYYSYLLIFF